MKRFVSIWFQHLKTDWMARHDGSLKNIAFALAEPDHGRMVITEPNLIAEKNGIEAGMVAADARVILPELKIIDDRADLTKKLLHKMAHWAIRFTPSAKADLPDGLLLDVTGCAHLWNGENCYIETIKQKLEDLGYHISISLADTIGAAWGMARYGGDIQIIPQGKQKEYLAALPPSALRIQKEIQERLLKLGLYRIGNFMNMDRKALRRRFGNELVVRLEQALGNVEECITPVTPQEPYEERLPCMDPIRTRKGIDIAREKLLYRLCTRMKSEGKGIRTAIFTGYRMDGAISSISISTNQPSVFINHLNKLFECKMDLFEPGCGIEVFTLSASKVQVLSPLQTTLWSGSHTIFANDLNRLVDYVQGRFGKESVTRFLPAQHHMPERSYKPVQGMAEEPEIAWKTERRRPIHMLQPERILVTAPVPDYPPMNFQYKGKLHKVKKADGPERIEPEWWIEAGLHRDYYVVEDEEGTRFWIFRLGHYSQSRNPEWYLHGIFT